MRLGRVERSVLVAGEEPIGSLGAKPVAERGAALLALPQDQWFDRKSNRTQPTDLANAMIGFANAEGGLVVVGLHGGLVEGIDARPERLSGWEQAALDFTVPAVPCRCRLVDCIDHHCHRNRLLVVEIETSEVVHANRRDEVYLRVGDENRKLSLRFGQELGEGASTGEIVEATGRSRPVVLRQLKALEAAGLTSGLAPLPASAPLAWWSRPTAWPPACGNGPPVVCGGRKMLAARIRGNLLFSEFPFVLVGVVLSARNRLRHTTYFAVSYCSAIGGLGRPEALQHKTCRESRLWRG